ncbi:unnamed protein product [Microthlaspi erraticum]|uniref:NAC domain-containing protein n=1 Tax=Microthlaspi erraticum TaxID=1685480 RepID=A0A6D2J277_9BRAS|nr:unnamed protein product [Microthlaspi erraticum]
MTVEAFPAPAEVPAKTTLPPGFRFHPSDEELVSYYLKKKVLGKPCCDAIVEIDINKHEPWELAEYSKLRTREQECYFFSGIKVSRRTSNGYWKTTGKDEEIRRGNKHLIGMRKTLVFYCGRAPYGLRTDWLIHEYRLLDDDEPQQNQAPQVQQGAYVLCKLFLNKPRGNCDAAFMEEELDGENVRVMADHVPFVVDANVINELPREFEIDNDHIAEYPHNDDETLLMRESAAAEVLPLCVLNKEAPLPLIQYKRKRKNESLGNTLKEEALPLCLFNKEAPLPLIQYKRKRKTTQDHCPSTTTTVDTSIAAMAAVLLDFSLTGCSKEENLRTKENKTESVVTMGPKASSYTKPIKDVQKEKNHQIVVERDKLKLDLMSAEMIINLLQGRINALRDENEELRKNISSSNNNHPGQML